MKTSRIEALSDGVFAIAMTLLIFGIKTPSSPEPVTTAGLWWELVGLFPHVAGYIVSFVILGTLWIGQHNQFHLIQWVDRPLLWLNIFFLACIAFLPFTTSLLAEYPEQPLANVVYAVTLVLAGIFLYAHWAYATKGRRLVSQDLGADAIRAAKLRIASGLAVYAVAGAASFFSTKISLVLFAVMPIIYMLPGRIDPHLKT